MKEYLMKEYKRCHEMAEYLGNRSDRLSRETAFEYTGARMEIGKILTDLNMMTDKELNDFHCSLIVKTA